MAPPRRMLTPASIRRECEASLKRLGIDRIDSYQFHWPDDTGKPVEDSWAEMSRLVEQGKIRAAGGSNFDALLDRCEAIRHVDSLQPLLSLIHRAGAREIAWAERHGTGVICYSPIQSGLLTDSFTADRVAAMPADDWRAHDVEFQQPALGRNLALRDALRPIAKRRGVPVSSVAVAWTLAWPGVSGAIVGARAPKQVDGWIDAAFLTLTPQDLEDIAAAVERTGAATDRSSQVSRVRLQFR
jgi:aryl-alcohol dehydrogenase-like predicted oxidoreductase